MAQYGEWTQKGATLSEATAQEEYGISRELIIAGIEAGRLEYRDGAVWGNPYDSMPCILRSMHRRRRRRRHQTML